MQLIKFTLILLSFISVSLFADSLSNTHSHTTSDARAIDHAPIGIMTDHYHSKGESMLSVRQGYMEMSGNALNGNSISNSSILAMPNPLGNMPANLSVVPVEMDMQMTMVGAMYAPSDKVTLMAMAMYMSKEMSLSTYKPMMDRALIGQFSTSSSDLSDISLGALIKLQETAVSRWHGEVTLQKSIGDNDAKDLVLTPMGMNMEMILPYGMQAGDDTVKLVLGITNVKALSEKVVWGNQLRGKFVISDNDWSFGDQIELNTWLQYELNKSVSFSSRLKFVHQDKISGSNPMISAPVQAANPENYGGREIHFAVGINVLTHILPGQADRFGLELVAPIQQDKNGLQMETGYQLNFGYQKAF
mgnify:CR=1 FL=1|jgi:hypothetical protein